MGSPNPAAQAAYPQPGMPGAPGGQQAPQAPQYAPVSPQQPHPPQQVAGGGAGFGRMVQSEWTKIRTVRSTMWSLIIMAVLIVGMAMLLGATLSHKPDNPDPSVSTSLIGVMIAQIAAATLGVLTISAEYTTGMIRSTLTAHPRRLSMLAAKALVFAGVMFVVGLVTCYLAYLVGDSMLSRDVVRDSSNSELLRGVLGSATYLALLGLFSLGVGTILRHSAGAITTVLGIMLLPMIFGGFIPGKAGEWIIEYSPMMLLIKMIAPIGDGEGSMGPWPGMVLMACYAAGALAVGASLLKSRDV